MIEFLKSKEFYILFLLYFISNALLLLNTDGVYWDGWAVYHQDDVTLKLLFDQIQHGIKGEFFLWLSHIGNGIYGFRVFVFISSFFNGVLVYLILKNIKELDRQTLFFLTLIFLIVPVASAKISIAIIPFLFPVFIFYVAFYVLSRYLNKPLFIFRYVALALFFISFSTNSVLVFYFSIFLYIYYHEFAFKVDGIIKKAKTIALRYWDFLLLPFIYFAYKSMYLKPHGLYENYNKISLLNLFDAVKIVFQNFDTSFINIIFTSLYSFSFFWFYGIILIYFIVKKSKYLPHTEQVYKIFFFTGIALFVLAVFPYAMIGKLANDSWNSRFQILTPLGFSFMIFFGLLYLKKIAGFSHKTFLFTIWILIASFIGQNVTMQYYALKDYFYTVSIEENVKENKLIQEHTTFVVNNNTTDSLLYNRTPIYYELNGMFKEAFGDDKRLAIRYDHYKKDLKNMSRLQRYEQYNFSQWKEEEPFLVTMTHNYKVRFGQGEYLNMIFLHLYDKEKFFEMAKQLIYITVEKLPKETSAD